MSDAPNTTFEALRETFRAEFEEEPSAGIDGLLSMIARFCDSHSEYPMVKKLSSVQRVDTLAEVIQSAAYRLGYPPRDAVPETPPPNTWQEVQLLREFVDDLSESQNRGFTTIKDEIKELQQWTARIQAEIRGTNRKS